MHNTNASRRRRLRRVPPTRFRLQPRHTRILILLYHIRYATAEILALLYAAGSGAGSKRVRNDLGDLYHAGYAERWYYPSHVSGFGSEQYVYAITTRGARAVLPPRLYTAQASSLWHRAQKKAASTIPHRLAISKLHAILAVGCTGTPEMTTFLRDQTHPDLRVSVRLPGESRRTTIQPDAGAVLAWPDGRKTLYLVEIDLTHRNRSRATRRFQAYHAYLTAHAAELKRRFGVDGAAALFVGDSRRRADHLREMARDVFVKTPRRRRPRVLFWATEHWHEVVLIADSRYETARPRKAIRAPGRILSERTVRTLEGQERQLFPQAPSSQAEGTALH